MSKHSECGLFSGLDLFFSDVVHSIEMSYKKHYECKNILALTLLKSLGGDPKNTDRVWFPFSLSRPSGG